MNACFKEIRYNSNIYYYVEPWDGLFYKDKLYSKVSAKEFENSTGLTFTKFYELHKPKEIHKAPISEVMLKYLDVPVRTKEYCALLITKLSTNTKFMQNHKILDLIIEHNLAKPFTTQYRIVCNKQAIKTVLPYVISSSKNEYIVELPTYSDMHYISKMWSIDSNIYYEVYTSK